MPEIEAWFTDPDTGEENLKTFDDYHEAQEEVNIWEADHGDNSAWIVGDDV